MFNMAICDDDPFVLEEMERLMEIYLEDTHLEKIYGRRLSISSMT